MLDCASELSFTNSSRGQPLAANGQSPAEGPKSIERVRQIILHSQTLGAHGMGYSSQSLNTLSRKLTPADVPTLIGLAADHDLHVGVQFALASQCTAALIPIREAVKQRKCLSSTPRMSWV